MTGRWPILVLSAALLAGCSSSAVLQSGHGNKYRYKASMIAPVKSKDMLYRDDQIIIQFRLDECALRFQLQNLSDSTLQIDWPNASIGIKGVYSPVRNLSDFYDTVTAQPATCSIPSLGVIRDVILPRGNTYFAGTRWHRDDLLPTVDDNSRAMKDLIAGMAGSPIEVLLPLAVGLNRRQYHFTLAVDSVSHVRWSDYQPPAWLPPEPPVHHLRPTREDQIVAVIVAGGLLGFLSYMLTAKKAPISR